MMCDSECLAVQIATSHSTIMQAFRRLRPHYDTSFITLLLYSPRNIFNDFFYTQEVCVITYVLQMWY